MNENREWKEKGTGTVKLNVDNDNCKKSRISKLYILIVSNED